MPRLKLRLVERTDLSRYLDPAARPPLFFVPGTPSVKVGDKVTLEVIIQGGPRVLLSCAVAWRRAAGDARARAGVGVTVEPTEQAKLDYLLGYARGGLLDMRAKRRLPVRLRVTYEAASGRRINFTRDLNEDGAFIRTVELPEEGAHTALLLSPPGAFKPLPLRAVVTRCHEEPPDRGVSVRFEFASDEERARMVAFVDKLEQDYLAGTLPEDALL